MAVAAPPPPTSINSHLLLLLLLLLLLQLLAVAAFSVPSSAGSPPPVVSRIAFGSCSNQSSPQPIWDGIMGFDPQVFIWLGDNIYGDNWRPLRIVGKERTIGPWKNTPRFFPSSEAELRRRYSLAKSNPGYSKLRQSTRVIGTWDDHDYGLNDAGKEFSEKNTNQRLMLDFLDEHEDSPRRKQAGVYTSYTFGPNGKQIKVILLDTRYHRDPLLSDGTILGDFQWAWLERELNGPKTEVTIIASSIQVVSNLSATIGPLFSMEAWGRFPKERERLYNLITDSKRDGVIFISGDVHFGEIARDDCGTGYPLYDITSSGLTQAVENDWPLPLTFLVRLVAWIPPTTMRVYGPTCRHKSCTYGQPNFGSIEIEWNATPPKVKLEVRDVKGNTVSGVSTLLSELQHGTMRRTSRKEKGYLHHCSLEIDLRWIYRYRLTFLLFGAIAASVFATFQILYVSLSVIKKVLCKRKSD